MIQNSQCFTTYDSVFGVTSIQVALQSSLVVCLSSEDVSDTLCIYRNCTCDRVILISIQQICSRQDQHFMRVGHTSHMSLSATDDNTVFSLFYNVCEQIRISLLGRLQTSVTLNVSHSTRDHKIIFLYVRHPLLESFMVIRTILLVHVVSCNKSCVHRIESYTSLEACTSLLCDHSHHLYFIYQIFDALVNMRETVYLLSGQMRSCCHQVLIHRITSQIICHGCRIYVRLDHWVIYHAVDFFSHVVNSWMDFS